MQQWCDRGIGPTKRFYTKPWCVAEPFGGLAWLAVP